MKAIIKDFYMYLLGAVVIALCFFLAYMLIITAVPESNRDIVTVAFGIILGWGGLVVGYFFGTSKSSSDKTQIMAGVSAKEAEKNE